MDRKDYELETVPAHKVGDTDLALSALKVLKDHYPGYYWRVGVNDEKSGGIMYIMNMTVNEAIFCNTPYGYVLKLSNVYQDPTLKCVMRAGGEILERAKMVRGWYNEDAVTSVDGIPLKHQPIETQRKIILERLNKKIQQNNVIDLAMYMNRPDPDPDKTIDANTEQKETEDETTTSEEG